MPFHAFLSPQGNINWRIIGFLILSSILLATLSVLHSTRVVSPGISIIGTLIIFVGFLPSLIYVLLQSNFTLPWFPAIGIFYAVFYGLPVFTLPLVSNDDGSVTLYSRVTLNAISSDPVALVLVGLSAMTACFYIGRYLVFRPIPKLKLSRHVQECRSNILLWPLLIGHLLYRYSESLASLPSIGNLLEPAGYVAYAGFFLLWKNKKLSQPEAAILLCVCLPLEIYVRIKFLLLTDILLFAIFTFFVMWKAKYLKQTVVIAIAGVLILSVFGASTASRSGKVAGFERLQHVAKAYVTQMIKGEKEWKEFGAEHEKFDGRFGGLVRRTGQLWIFHVVDNLSPGTVPYWGGESYQPLKSSFVPRFIYPNKPLEVTGAKFGKAYGFIPESDVHTSVNLPWLTELLVNFGRMGVVYGMAVIGLLLALLDRVFNSKSSGNIEFTIGLTLIFPLVYPESNFSVMTGVLPILAVFLIVYFELGSRVLTIFNKKP